MSRTTASRVLNDRPSVRPELRAHVRGVMDRLAYVPDEVARSLRRQRTGVVGLLIPRPVASVFADAYFAALVTAVAAACARADLLLALLPVDRGTARAHVAAQLHAGALLDGVLATASTDDDPFLSVVLAGAAPVVVIGEVTDAAVATVDVDNERGGRLAVEHLLATGRQRVAIVAGPRDNAAARARARGAALALAAAGHQPCLTTRVPFATAGGRAIAPDVVASGADAVVAGSDAIGVGVVGGLLAAGVGVPDDVAVVGFDDLSPARTSDPPLTTVAQPVEAIADTAVARLVALLAGRATGHTRDVLDVALVVRGSG